MHGNQESSACILQLESARVVRVRLSFAQDTFGASTMTLPFVLLPALEECFFSVAVRSVDETLYSPCSAGLHMLLASAECHVEVSEIEAVMQKQGWLGIHSFDYGDFRKLWAGLIPEDSSMQRENSAENARAKPDDQAAMAPAID